MLLCLTPPYIYIYILQAAAAFEQAESSRLHHTEQALRQYCTIEKQALEARLRLLSSFEEGAIRDLNAEKDLELFAGKGRDADATRQCSHALRMMEWDHASR